MSAVYTFKWPKGPQEVILTGSFDNWSKSLFLVKQADGSFELTVPLPTHNDEILYKYIVDGQWKVSSTEKVVDDESGIENNYVDAKDLLMSQGAGSRIPESGGLFVAGSQAKKGDLNTTVMPSTEGKHATISGEPGIQIPQDKDSLAAFTKFENPTEKNLKTAVMPSTSDQQASIAGEPGIQIPQDKDSLAAFTKFENPTEKNLKTTVMPSTSDQQTSIAGEPGIQIPQDKESLAAFSKFETPNEDATETSELSPEEKKKQKKKVKRSQYKAKKKKAAETTGAFGAGGATAGGFSDASRGVPEGAEGTEDAEDNDAGDKNSGAVALGDVPVEKSNAKTPAGISGLASQTSDSNGEFLPVVSASETSRESSLAKKQTEDSNVATNETSNDENHSPLGGVALGGAALGGAALGALGGGALGALGGALGGAAVVGGAATSDFGGDQMSDLSEYAGNATQVVDEKKSAAQNFGAPSSQFASNKESGLPNYSGAGSQFADKENDAAVIGGGEHTSYDRSVVPQAGAINDNASSAIPQNEAKDAAVISDSEHSLYDRSVVPQAGANNDNASSAIPQSEAKDANVSSSAEKPSATEKYGAPALTGAAVIGTGAAITSVFPEDDAAPQVESARHENPDKKNDAAVIGGGEHTSYDRSVVPQAGANNDNASSAIPQSEAKDANVSSSAEKPSATEKYGAPALTGAAVIGTGAAITSVLPEDDAAPQVESARHENDVTSQVASAEVPVNDEENPSSTLDPKAKETSLNKEVQPGMLGTTSDVNAEREVDASPVTKRDAPLNQYASADEIVIAQGADNKTNVEDELRAREHGDVIVEEIQPTESEKERLTEEAHLFDTIEKPNSGTKSNNSKTNAVNTSSSNAANTTTSNAASGTSAKKTPSAKKDVKKESKKDAKKDEKKDEKKKKGIFSKLKSVFK